mgnify:CR=1 FL=1
MKKGTFFYNYTASKTGVNAYSLFSYGIFTANFDGREVLPTEAFKKIEKQAKEKYPDADNINFTAFNLLVAGE